MTNLEISENLRYLRECKGVSQEYIGDLLGIKQSSYSAYETGKADMPASYLLLLANFYGVTADYILGRTDYTVFPDVMQIRIGSTTSGMLISEILSLSNKGKALLLEFIDLLKMKYASKK